MVRQPRAWRAGSTRRHPVQTLETAIMPYRWPLSCPRAGLAPTPAHHWLSHPIVAGAGDCAGRPGSGAGLRNRGPPKARRTEPGNVLYLRWIEGLRGNPPFQQDAEPIDRNWSAASRPSSTEQQSRVRSAPRSCEQTPAAPGRAETHAWARRRARGLDSGGQCEPRARARGRGLGVARLGVGARDVMARRWPSTAAAACVRWPCAGSRRRSRWRRTRSADS